MTIKSLDRNLRYRNKGGAKMMIAVTEDTIATGKETASSPGVLVEGNAAEMNQHDDKQQPHFSEPKNGNSNETTSGTFTDVEDTFPKHGNGNSDTDDSSKGDFSYFDIFLSAYVPLILLWFRRSMFGPAKLIRTIIVGQLMRVVFVDSISEWMSEKLLPWLEVLSVQSSATADSISGPFSAMLGTGNGKQDPHAWPPPAFTALAMLTIFALVVHPDGLTWIFLGKLRDAIYAVFSALGQSLEFVLNDYGVFPTLFAAATLAAIFCIVFIILRTLSPKTTKNNSNKHNNTLHNERKKKKKKGGNTRHRRENHQHQNQQRSTNKIKPSPRPQSQIEEEVENASTVASPRSPLPSQPPSEVQSDGLASKAPTSLENSINSPPSVPTLSAPSPPIATNIKANEPVEQATNNPVPIPNNTIKPKENRTRRRMMSGSTMDTTPMSDDQSCGSTSVRSFPSVSVNSNRSGKKSNKGSASTPRRGKRHGTVKSPKSAERNSGKKNRSAAAASVESSMPSRWDALRPEHGNGGGKSNNTAYSHHHANGSTLNKKQQQQRQNHKANPRRGHGTSGNGQNRKGRQNQRSRTNAHPSIDRNSAATTPVPSSGASSQRGNRGRSNTREVSPMAAAAREQQDGATWPKPSATNTTTTFLGSSTVSPESNSAPTLPPGFQGGSSAAHGVETNYKDRHDSRYHGNDDSLVTALFETPLAIPPLSEREERNFSRASPRKPSPQQRNEIAVISPDFFAPAANSSGGLLSGGSGSRIQENPFASSNNKHDISSRHQANLDSQIEADLHELGGQMAGSILDF